MSRFPSSLTMMVSILIIAALSSLRYSRKLEGAHFQLKFDWNNKKEIQGFQHIHLDSLDYNYLQFSGMNLGLSPNNQHTFAIQVKKWQQYYFRFIDHEIHGDTLVMQAVEWLTGVPELQPGYVDLYELDVALKHNRGKNIVTIGDEMLIKDEAKYFRRKIATLRPVNFLGSKKDVFNFKHEADYGYTIDGILQDIERIPEADWYIIFVHTSLDASTSDLSRLLDTLLERQTTHKVLWISVPDLRSAFQQFNSSAWSEVLDAHGRDRLILLDGATLFEGDVKSYYMQDSVHLNKQAYEKLAEATVKLLR